MELSPREIVSELDRYVVGQQKAKRAVAVALRNRWRHQRLSEEMQEEVYPKNILMIGPTGVGKTEISRRLAKLVGAPFVKVEATKFTEVGYVGRDVEQIIRDLVQAALEMEKEKQRKRVEVEAQIKLEARILEVLGRRFPDVEREELKRRLYKGQLDKVEIEIEVEDTKKASMPMVDMPDMPGLQAGMLNLGNLFGKGKGSGRKKKKLKVKDAMNVLHREETEALLDHDEIQRKALIAAEKSGVVFIDEIDKVISSSEGRGFRGDVSREGVQRDLLPLIEGTTVTTKHGTVNTRHILFIASGAFQLGKPSDLLPELQGRLPVRVDLEPLTKEDLKQILTATEASLVRQYVALFATEGVELEFTEGAIDKIVALTEEINATVENIGARRLYTIMEKAQENLSFKASECAGEKFTIDAEYVGSQVKDLGKGSDISRFIL